MHTKLGSRQGSGVLSARVQDDHGADADLSLSHIVHERLHLGCLVGGFVMVLLVQLCQSLLHMHHDSLVHILAEEVPPQVL